MKLTTKEITFLARDFTEKSAISLLANLNEALDGTEENSLREKGIYNLGKLTNQARELLDLVAKAKHSTRLILKDSYVFVEKYTYRIKNKIVLVENDGGEMVFSILDDFSKVLHEISEFTGMSMLKTVNIEVLLTKEETLVLLAMVDIYRKNALLSYAGQKIPPAAVWIKDILGQLNTPTQNSLVQMLKNNYRFPAPPASKTQGFLESLIAKGCVDFKDGYSLTGEYEVFAKSFLIPDTILMTEVFNINQNNEVVVAGGLGVYAGIRDIAFFIFDDEAIELSSVSGRQMLQMVEKFLGCPDITEGGV